jgi:dipeptidyl aminopeptidase/acylaminoacyl peptidase
MPLKNVTPEFPPTVVIHGTADTDVLFEQSKLMADVLSLSFRTVPSAAI